MIKLNIILLLLFILFVYGNRNINTSFARNENFDDNKINTCINNECKNIVDVKTQHSKIIEKLDMINNRLDIIIKFKGMNKTNEEIKEELKTGIFILLKIFGAIIGTIIGISFIIISCINCEI